MKKLTVVLSLVVLWPMALLSAQVLRPNAAGVALSHWHTLVHDVEATKKFWMLLGGTPIKIDDTDVMKFPGVLVFLTPGSPPPKGNTGAVIDHPGFNIRNGAELLAKLKTAGVKVDPVGTSGESGMLTNPDGLRVEMQGTEFDLSKRSLLGFAPDRLDIPMASDHLHYVMPEAEFPAVQAWYVKVLGGNPLREPNSGLNWAADFPGARLRFGGTRLWVAVSPDGKPLAPTTGRALDHIGFEVKNLVAYCKKLEAMGVKFDQPYSTSRHASFSSAELTDPWGASIELTEGLNKF